MEITKIRYFIDMDGVLAKYDRYAYDRNNGPQPGVALFEYEPLHYFKFCTPDVYALKILDNLLLMHSAELYILTSVAQHIPWAIDDKKVWLAEHCPRIDINKQFIVANSDKAEVAKAILMADTLNRKTILIDDYNKNLIQWQDAGGMAVKYLNGVNSSSSWNGATIGNC